MYVLGKQANLIPLLITILLNQAQNFVVSTCIYFINVNQIHISRFHLFLGTPEATPSYKTSMATVGQFVLATATTPVRKENEETTVWDNA